MNTKAFCGQIPYRYCLLLESCWNWMDTLDQYRLQLLRKAVHVALHVVMGEITDLFGWLLQLFS